MCYSRPIILRCISSQYISYCFICHQCISYCSICCQYISCNQFPGGDCVDCTVLCVGTICVLKRLKQTIHKTRQHTQGTTHNKTQTRYDTHYSHNKTHNRYDTWGQQMRVNMVGRPLEDSANHWSCIQRKSEPLTTRPQSSNHQFHTAASL